MPQPPSVIGEPLELRHRQVQHPRDRRDIGQGETGHVDGPAGVQGLDDAHRVERRHERHRPRPPHVPVDLEQPVPSGWREHVRTLVGRPGPASMGAPGRAEVAHALISRSVPANAAATASSPIRRVRRNWLAATGFAPIISPPQQ